jgi:hypothetical protein
MSNVAKRPNRTPRRVREKRANQLVLVGSIAGVVAVVGFLLALFTAFSWGIVFIAAIVAVVCGVMFRGMITPK